MSIALGVGISSCFAAAIFSPVLLFDSFTGPNGTSLDAHSPDNGGPWSVVNGSLSLNGSGQAVAVVQLAHCVALADVGQADVTITSTAMSLDRQNRLGLLARATDYANNWLGYWDTNSQSISINESAGGFATTQRAVAAMTYVAGKLWNLTLSVSGNNITFTVTQADDPANTATVSYALMATNLTATLAGFDDFFESALSGGFDTLKVTHP